ncbi:MAG: carboxylesterase family protein [Silvibacterium sp.]
MKRKPVFQFMLVVTAFLLLQSCTLRGQNPIIHTSSGDVSGTQNQVTRVLSFKSIPFAEPPIGDLRWKPPAPVKPWKGVRAAVAFGPNCMQASLKEYLPWTAEFLTQSRVSEDCLYLNVWTPNVSPNANLPVIVFIHGGGFGLGGGDIAVYDGENLATTGLVIVTMNYRVGPFGFLAHPELTAESNHHSSGNYGLLDQIAALHWVTNNIKSFGGDPHRMTIWGWSAGAVSVNALIASPLASGLFQQAVADSGIGRVAWPLADLKTAEQSGAKFAATLHAASLKELRALSATELLNQGVSFSPVIDGWVLPDAPAVLSERGTDKDVPIITGYQANDAALFLPPTVTLDAFDQIVKQQYGNLSAEFQQLYPAKNAEEARQALLLSSRDRDRVSMFLWASVRAKNHHQPVYTYFFDRGIPWPQHPEFAAFHGSELPYFFLNLDKLDRPWEPIDRDLAKSAAAYLKNFATTGNPNGPGSATWTPVDRNDPSTMELGTRIGPMPLADKQRLDFWIRYFNSPEALKAPPF